MVLQPGENAPNIKALMELDWFRESVIAHAESLGYKFVKRGESEGV